MLAFIVAVGYVKATACRLSGTSIGSRIGCSSCISTNHINTISSAEFGMVQDIIMRPLEINKNNSLTLNQKPVY